MAGETRHAGDGAADEAADETRDERALETQGDAVEGGLGDPGHDGGGGRRERRLAQFRVTGAPGHRQGRAAKREIGTDFGWHHHAFLAGLGDGLDDGRGEDAVHAGHHQQGQSAPMMATDSQPR